MKITINDAIKIGSVQQAFNAAYPFLKVEFFSKPHQTGAHEVKNTIRAASVTLGECRKLHVDGEIEIVPGMTVKELEQEFMKHYGLFVQVFRKSGKVWLETTVTDNWTLEEQNRQGEEMSRVGYWKNDET